MTNEKNRVKRAETIEMKKQPMARKEEKKKRWKRTRLLTKRAWASKTEEREIYVRITLNTGKMTDFAVILKVPVKGAMTEIARYDYAHGYIHLDLLGARGQVERKEYRDSIRLQDAARNAYDDFKTNWTRYAEEYRQRCRHAS